MKNTFFILILILTFSCEKTEKDPSVSVITGLINDNMYGKEIDPELTLDISWSKCGIGTGLDSIDLNNDGSYDIFLDVTFIDPEVYFGAVCCPPPMDCIPSFIWYKIYGTENFEISSYYEALDDNTLWSYADTIPEGNRIDTLANWENSTKLWCMDTPVSNGAWYELEKDMFLGIRSAASADYKYGWIKVGVGINKNLVFKSYAFEN